MTPAELAALLVAYAAPTLAFLAGHPLALMALWQLLSALVTALARPGVRDWLGRTSPRLLGFVLFCEMAGINLPAVLRWAWVGLQAALDSVRRKP